MVEANVFTIFFILPPFKHLTDINWKVFVRPCAFFLLALVPRFCVRRLIYCRVDFCTLIHITRITQTHTIHSQAIHILSVPLSDLSLAAAAAAFLFALDFIYCILTLFIRKYFISNVRSTKCSVRECENVCVCVCALCDVYFVIGDNLSRRFD